MFALLPLLGILAVNAIPLVGVIWFGWSVFAVLLLYWFENVAIGVAHAARMAISTRTNAVGDGWSTTAFFALHYGVFTFVHGVFVIVFFGVVGGGFGEAIGGFKAPALAIVGWQAAYLFIDAARTDYFKGRTPNDLMFEPYPRVLAPAYAKASARQVGHTGRRSFSEGGCTRRCSRVAGSSARWAHLCGRLRYSLRSRRFRISALRCFSRLETRIRQQVCTR